MTVATASFASLTFLRRVLLVDAATCAAMGALLASASQPLGRLLALPPALLLYAGLALLPVAAFIAWAGTREPVARWAAGVVVAGNALWVLGSFALLVAGGVSPNALGVAFVAGQAIAVVVLAELEYAALRRMPA